LWAEHEVGGRRFLIGGLVFGNGTGVVWQFRFAKQGEVIQSALVDAVEAGLVTVEQVQLG
jgi:hypothetical protein